VTDDDNDVDDDDVTKNCDLI